MAARVKSPDSPDGVRATGMGRAGGFGARLATLRQSGGLTQTELGDAAGMSQRVRRVLRSERTQPPGALLVDFARALHVTTDALLGLKPIADRLAPKTGRLLKRLQRIEDLPPADQRAGLKLVDAMLDTRRRALPPRAKECKVRKAEVHTAKRGPDQHRW